MGKSEEIARLVQDAGGVATAAQITGAGFLPGSISHALKSGAIDKLTRGVYCSPEVFDDEFATVTYRWRKCVLSHGSALYLAGLSDRVPGALDVTVPHGYNPRGLFLEHPDVRIHRVNKDVYELGITEVTDALAIVCSEETGSISYCLFGNVTYNVTPTQLRAKIEEFFQEKEIE